ncbi:MAG TPA: 30S ribosome-binding factor RbfA [Planctomycetia bacterium]|nr:30S ribosome-binding factor RbfA [Planctomycetia bacterium]
MPARVCGFESHLRHVPFPSLEIADPRAPVARRIRPESGGVDRFGACILGRRPERIAEAVREAVANAVLFEIKDPRIEGVTVLRCEVAADLRSAKVYVSLMGDEKKRRRVMHGLNSSRGFLQRRIAERTDLRYTPVLEIIEDDSVKKSLELSRLLRENSAGNAESASGGSEPPSGESPDARPDEEGSGPERGRTHDDDGRKADD